MHTPRGAFGLPFCSILDALYPEDAATRLLNIVHRRAHRIAECRGLALEVQVHFTATDHNRGVIAAGLVERVLVRPGCIDAGNINGEGMALSQCGNFPISRLMYLAWANAWRGVE
jgi:hypothetical protein